MGVEADINLVRIGDGQCFVPKDYPSFVVHPDNPVAIIPIFSHLFLTTYNYSTRIDSFDAMCRINNRDIVAGHFFENPYNGGILVVERKLFERIAERDGITDLGCISLDHHRKFWDSLQPGF